MEAINWIMANWKEISGVILGIIALAEMVVRLTPTEKDNGAVERIGSMIKKALDFFKFPNKLK